MLSGVRQLQFRGGGCAAVASADLTVLITCATAITNLQRLLSFPRLLLRLGFEPIPAPCQPILPDPPVVVVVHVVFHRDPQLQFVEEVALPPPEVQIDLAEQQRNEQELAAAANAPLPADDDDELID